MKQMNEQGKRVATVVANAPCTIFRFSWHGLVERLLWDESITTAQRLELQQTINDYGMKRMQELFDLKE